MADTPTDTVAKKTMMECLDDHLRKVNRVPGGRLPIGYHFKAGWDARQAEIDEANSFIESLAHTCKEAEEIACRCIRGECASKTTRATRIKGGKP